VTVLRGEHHRLRKGSSAGGGAGRVTGYIDPHSRHRNGPVNLVVGQKATRSLTINRDRVQTFLVAMGEAWCCTFSPGG
jgi:hypothetical protein